MDGRLSRRVFSFRKKLRATGTRFLLMLSEEKVSPCPMRFPMPSRNKTRHSASCYVTLLAGLVLIVLELKHVVFGLFTAWVVCQLLLRGNFVSQSVHGAVPTY